MNQVPAITLKIDFVRWVLDASASGETATAALVIIASTFIVFAAIRFGFRRS
ncbi:hypothetical protein [Microvirga tunisiensis]|uniref:hypothetical protein n=1 Tax=Microvirga tunisiensis TaxID=2108360 RepID=UPI00129C1E47|nr:hypothetical protein [Microvirga tunisiensis]